MAKYRVYGVVTGGKYLGIYEASTPEEAMDMASDNASVNLCHQCCREVDGAEIHELQVEVEE